jgi:Lrp/AsnC ligand binding domain
VHLIVNAEACGVARRLATLPHVSYVVQTFGSCDISVDLQCGDLDELLEAVDRIARMDGIARHRFFQHDRVILTNPVWS